MNFNDHPNRGRTYVSTRGRDNSSSYATGSNRPRAQRKSEEVLLATDRPQTNDRCETQMRLGEVISQAGVTRIKEDVNPATRTGGKFQSLNQRATTIKRSSERSLKAGSVLKKSRCCKFESDGGCIVTWIEVIRLHFEEKN